MGQLGFSFLKPGDTNWLVSTTNPEINNSDGYTEFAQTDYDVYDEVTEIKINADTSN